MFTRIGPAAYKKDLTNSNALSLACGNPHLNIKTIHIAGTNGKGSVSSMLASVLQSKYKVGLFTSPHLIDFRERIRINGEMISKEDVCEYLNTYVDDIERIEPSFFEMSTVLGFWAFRKYQVDYAVIETGLGGRLDSTNIINPLLSIITNIGYDHQNMLGNTLEEIAGEKAGIIKKNVPVVIGRLQAETKSVFEAKAESTQSVQVYAQDKYTIIGRNFINTETQQALEVDSDLIGNYQQENLRTTITAIDELNKLGLNINEDELKTGLSQVIKRTGLRGRWEILQLHPQTIIAEVAHNVDGLTYLKIKLEADYSEHKTAIVFGMVNDKDANIVFDVLPKAAHYYMCKPNIPRGKNTSELMELAAKYQLQATECNNVQQAVVLAITTGSNTDKSLILITGSIFVVAEALEYWNERK